MTAIVVTREINRKRYDGRWRSSLWIADGPHLHGNGRTLIEAQRAVQAQLAWYVDRHKENN